MITGIPAVVHQKGRELWSYKKIKIVHKEELVPGIKQVQAKAYCSFGFVHHPVIRVEEASDVKKIREYACDCYESNDSDGVCSHCVALMLEAYGDVNAVVEKTSFTGTVLSEGQGQLAQRYRLDKVFVTEQTNTGKGETFFRGKVFAEFGFVHHPRLRLLHDQIVEYECDCYLNGRETMCPHCEALYHKINIKKENTVPQEESLYSPENPRTMEILFGTKEDETPVYWHPNDTNELFHTNTGIIGTMGTGKTQFTKSVITQMYCRQSSNFGGHKLGILIFDYKGDYNESKADFVSATNARILKPYRLPYNPFSLIGLKDKPQLPVHVANTFADTISKIYKLGSKQFAALLHCITEAYKRKGIVSSNRETWKYQAPVFEDVYRVYSENEEIKKFDSLYAVMEKLHQFEIFEDEPFCTQSLFELLSGVVVIDLSGYDEDIQSLIVAITLELFYSQMLNAGSSQMDGQYRQLTKLILVDEADNFMSEGFPALKKIMKEGREFGVGTILSTQFLKHFGTGTDDYSKYILTWVVHNVADLRRSDVEFVFGSDSDAERLFQDIKSLPKHHSIARIGNGREPVYFEDKAFWTLKDSEM